MPRNYYYAVTMSASTLLACFGQPITFTAKALRIWTQGERKGETEDVTSEIAWRKPVAGRGATYTKVWHNRVNTRVAVYLEGHPYRAIDVHIICCALGQDSNMYDTHTQLLARMMMAEGSTASDEERIAIGYVGVNLYRFQPRYFGANLEAVINDEAFEAMGDKLAENLASEAYVRETLTQNDCEKYARTLIQAQSILNDSISQQEPLFIRTGKHAFYFNRSSDIRHAPDRDRSPRILKKGELGFIHSFYTSNRCNALPLDIGRGTMNLTLLAPQYLRCREALSAIQDLQALLVSATPGRVAE